MQIKFWKLITNAVAILIVSNADDTTLETTIEIAINKSQNAIAENKINIELDLINNWLKCNKLSLNIGKSKYIIFHNPQTKVDYLNIKIENTYIERVKEFDFQGLIINENLNWKAHINKIANKISKRIGILRWPASVLFHPLITWQDILACSPFCATHPNLTYIQTIHT